MPARLRDIQRAVKALGIEVTSPRGPHPWKAHRKSDGVSYGIPAHNGLKTEISDKYIRGLCRAFGIDETQLRKLL